MDTGGLNAAAGRGLGAQMITPVLAFATLAVMLPRGETHLSKPFEPRNVSIQGDPAGSTLVMDEGFEGAAAIVLERAHDVVLRDFSIRGNRRELKSEWYLPLKEAAFADFYNGNGILLRGSERVTVRGVKISNVRAFALLVNASSKVTVDAVTVSDSGTLNQKGRNNTTGGILLEEGVRDFEVMRCLLTRIAGTAVWTHSYARSPRNSRGSIHDNTISFVARDAVQVGHATNMNVMRNHGSSIGYPAEQVDAENYGTPVALDTAGNVDASLYADNRFTDVNGECVNLDGFHDGQVVRNSCLNQKSLAAYPSSHYAVIFGNHDPGMDSTGVVLRDNTMRGFAYGAVFLAGFGNRIENNRFSRLNLAHCGAPGPVSPVCNYALETPGMLRAGIYLSDNGGRSTRNESNIISGNAVSGFGMSAHCVEAGPGVDLKRNRAHANSCVNSP